MRDETALSSPTSFSAVTSSRTIHNRLALAQLLALYNMATSDVQWICIVIIGTM